MHINYDHTLSPPALESARAGLSRMLAGGPLPKSLLDAGCGQGEWTKAALELGIPDVLGIDGIDVSKSGLQFPKKYFQQVNFGKHWDLGRRFDIALCLEVAEHLPEDLAEQLVIALQRHTDVIYFSAASPGQPGQHHVNCQWPDYWQSLFNKYGFVCVDVIRWQLWNDIKIEPWYRQNMFKAERNVTKAGNEPRLKAVVHPDLLNDLCAEMVTNAIQRQMVMIQSGRMYLSWYFAALATALWHRITRCIQIIWE